MEEWEINRVYFDENVKPIIQGKVSQRVYNLIARSYLTGAIKGPLAEIEDKKLSWIYGVGITTLAQIRKVVPALAPDTK